MNIKTSYKKMFNAKKKNKTLVRMVSRLNKKEKTIAIVEVSNIIAIVSNMIGYFYEFRLFA